MIYPNPETPTDPAGIYLLEANTRNTRTRCEVNNRDARTMPRSLNMFKVNNKNTRTATSFWCFYC